MELVHLLVLLIHGVTLPQSTEMPMAIVQVHPQQVLILGEILRLHIKTLMVIVQGLLQVVETLGVIPIRHIRIVMEIVLAVQPLILILGGTLLRPTETLMATGQEVLLPARILGAIGIPSKRAIIPIHVFGHGNIYMKMKRLCILMVFLIGNTIISLAQGNRLDQNPEVNGLRIGMPYSEISDILEYRQRTDMGAKVYAVKDIRYYSLYGVVVDDVAVFVYEGYVTGIFFVKRFAPGTALRFTEQQTIETGLTRKYGPPMYNVSDPNADPALFGVQWKGRNHEATVCTYYYGIDGGFSLTYLLAEIK